MSGSIVELLYPKGILVKPNHDLGDQALLNAPRGSLKLLEPGVHDVTPRKKVWPPLEYFLTILMTGEGEITSNYPLSLADIQMDKEDALDFPNYESGIRRINHEIPSQVISGFNERRELLIFAYYFFVQSLKDPHYQALRYLMDRKSSS